MVISVLKSRSNLHFSEFVASDVWEARSPRYSPRGETSSLRVGVRTRDSDRPPRVFNLNFSGSSELTMQEIAEILTGK
ncbi:hypothetical protein CKA32_005465 [Geitlerinema sp. FC II]|nr:hypothetical protein CKA32_005465 [Geitlerinema sp. FC II]